MLTISCVQNILSFALESVVVLSVFYFVAMLIISHSDWLKRKAAEVETVMEVMDKAAEQLQLEPLSVETHEPTQILMPPQKSKGEKEHPKKKKQKKATGKNAGATKPNYVKLNGKNVQVYKLRGNEVVMVDNLPFAPSQTVKTYQLHGKPAIDLLTAQEIAKQFTAAKEVKLAA